MIGDLTAKLRELHAAGAKPATIALVDRYGVGTSELESVAGPEGIPVDIRSIYTAAGE